MRRSYGRSEGRSLRAQALLTGSRVVAGPATSPVEAEEIVAAGATVAPHVSRPRQAPLGPRRFAFIHGPRRAHRGPGGYCRHSGNRVPRAGLPGPTRLFRRFFAKDRALQAWRGASSLATLAKGKPSARGLSWRGHQAEGLGEASSLAGFPSSPSQLCLLDRAHMGSVLPAESRTRQSAMTAALQLPF